MGETIARATATGNMADYYKQHPSQGFIRDNFFTAFNPDEKITPYYKQFFLGPDKPDQTLPPSPKPQGVDYAQGQAAFYGDPTTAASTVGVRRKTNGASSR